MFPAVLHRCIDACRLGRAAEVFNATVLPVGDRARCYAVDVFKHAHARRHQLAEVGERAGPDVLDALTTVATALREHWVCLF